MRPVSIIIYDCNTNLRGEDLAKYERNEVEHWFLFEKDSRKLQ